MLRHRYPLSHGRSTEPCWDRGYPTVDADLLGYFDPKLAAVGGRSELDVVDGADTPEVAAAGRGPDVDNR
jgi:hypothetical protein